MEDECSSKENNNTNTDIWISSGDDKRIRNKNKMQNEKEMRTKKEMKAVVKIRLLNTRGSDDTKYIGMRNNYLDINV